MYLLFAYEVNVTNKLNVAMLPNLPTMPLIFLEEKEYTVLAQGEGQE